MIEPREFIEGVQHALKSMVYEALVAELLPVGVVGANLLQDVDESLDLLIAHALIGEWFGNRTGLLL